MGKLQLKRMKRYPTMNLWSLLALPVLLGWWSWQLQRSEPIPAPQPQLSFLDIEGCAGRDTSVSILTSCPDNSVVLDFMDALPGNPAPGGEWINVDNVPADLSDSTAVDFAAFPSGTFRFDYALPAGGGCPADTARLTVDVTNLRNLTFRDTIAVGLDDSCRFVVQPNQFIILPDLPNIDGLYDILLVSPDDIAIGDTITAEYVGELLTALIVIPGCSEVYGEGVVRVQDNRPPRIDSIIDPLQGDSLLCYDIDSILNVDASWQDPDYRYYIGGPVFSDNCFTPQISVTDDIVYGECDSSYATLFRTFTAEDDFGQSFDTLIQYPFYVPTLKPAAKLDDVYINTCTPAGVPVPPTYPFIINAFGDTLFITENECDHSSGFEDREFVECGGTRKIERIIKLFDWCTDEAFNVDTIIIRIGDFEGPMIRQGADTISVSTAPFACEASFRLDQEFLEDVFALEFTDCSSSIALSTSFISYLPELDFWGAPTGDTSWVDVDYPVNRNVVSGIPLGLHGLIINASDGCGNRSVDTTYFRVKDFIAPTVQCDDSLHVTLNSAGYAQVMAVDVDEGTEDNCQLDRLRIRRQVSPSCQANYDRNNNGVVVGDELDDSGYTRFDDPVTNGEYVEFWCCDLDASPEVELWAWDIYGNVSFCQMELLLEDKFLPRVAAPADTITNCLDPALSGDLSAFGLGQIVGDECGLVELVELDPVFDLEQCGTGTITRRFQTIKFRNDPREARSEIATQTITVEAINDYEICFPKDVEATCGTDPTIPGITFSENACDLVAVDVQDTRFDATSDECYKIFRTYEVINWCEYDGESDPIELDRDVDGNGIPGDSSLCVLVRPNGVTYFDADNDEFNIQPTAKGYWYNSNEQPAIASRGFWRYTQIIKVYDPFAPTISAVPQDTFCPVGGDAATNCSATIAYPFSVSENCTEQVAVRVLVDVDADGSNIRELPESNLQGGFPNFIIRGTYPIGEHIFLVEARDGCGNVSREQLRVIVEDCKAPAPICANQLNVELAPTDPTDEVAGRGSIEVGAFLRSTIYDCSGQGPQGRVTHFSINRADEPVDPGQLRAGFTCADVGDLVEVHVYAWDEAGNGDHCTAYVEVQDNIGACAPPTAMISGVVLTEGGEPVENVEVLLSGGEERMHLTNAQGTYRFDRLASGGTYTIRPGLNTDHSNGISTFDLILVQKHILGIDPLQSPYQLIAADVNNSGGISTLDLIQLRRIILRETDSFLGNQSWRFVMSDYGFADPSAPWKDAMPENMEIRNLEGTRQLDFMAIKIGDVSGNATVNSGQPAPEVRNDDELRIQITDQWIEPGTTHDILLTSDDLDNIQGMQFTLESVHPALSIEHVVPMLLGNEHMGMTADQRVRTFSWNRQPGVNIPEAGLFMLRIRAEEPVRLQDALRITSTYTAAEAYNEFDELLNVQLDWQQAGVGERPFAVLELAPNPFREKLLLRFSLPAVDPVVLTVWDPQGRTVWQREWTADAGMNEYYLSATDLAGEGLYFFRLQAPGGSREGEFVLVK